MAIFILEHRTPKTVRFIPASMVHGSGAGFTYKKLRKSEATFQYGQVMAAIGKTMRNRGVYKGLLKDSFEDAQQLYPSLMRGASYVAGQPNGRPAMIVIKDE